MRDAIVRAYAVDRFEIGVAMGLNGLRNQWIGSAIVHVQGVARDGFEYDFNVSDRRDGTIDWTVPFVDGTSVTFSISSSRGRLSIQPRVGEQWAGPCAVVSRAGVFGNVHKEKWRAIGIAMYLVSELPDGEEFPRNKARRHFRTFLTAQSVFDPESQGAERQIVEVVPSGYVR